MKRPLTKIEVQYQIAQRTGLDRKQVGAVFSELENIIHEQVGMDGVGAFNLAGLIKIERVTRGPYKARKWVNPRTGETKQIGPGPVRMALKIKPLKRLKEFERSEFQPSKEEPPPRE